MKNERSRQASRVTIIGLLWNVCLTIFKMVIGLIGNSAALIADSIHSLSDFASDLAVLGGLKIAEKPVDDTHNYGHGKFETLTTIFIGISLLVICAAIFWNGLANIYEALTGGELMRPKWIALTAVVASLVVKEGLYHYTLRIGRDIESPAVIANAWHHRTDALSSVAVLIGIGGTLVLSEKWAVLDPIAAVVVSVMILKVAIPLIKNSVNELMEASLNDEQINMIKHIADGVPGAINPHNIKTRRIGNYVAIDMHLKVDPDLNIVEAHDIASDVEGKLKEKFGAESFISIHIEPNG